MLGINAERGKFRTRIRSLQTACGSRAIHIHWIGRACGDEAVAICSFRPLDCGFAYRAC